VPVPWLIDTDPGIDDALAILLALACPEVSIEAITSVAGNVPVDCATTNAHRILAVGAPAASIPVARGASAPLHGPLVTAMEFHGDDGLGGVTRLREPDGRLRYPAPADSPGALDGPGLILETAARFAGELVIVALGPLTNLAVALERDRVRLSRVARIVVMGGAVAVPGNVTPSAEFNFHVDPDAAAAILRRAELAAALGRGRADVARFIEDFTDHLFVFGDHRGHDGFALHDPLAVGVALDPSLVDFELLHVDVEDEGRITRGASVADRRDVPPAEKARPNCRVAMTVHTARFLELFLTRVASGGPSRQR
jgi:inosine-uridine nucleoside N-ribohydrolase